MHFISVKLLTHIHIYTYIHLIPPVTIVTVKKVFIYKALKILLTGVLVHFLQIWKQINKGSQLNMCSFTWLVQIVTWPEHLLFAPWDDDGCIKAPKQKDSKVW